MLERPEAGREGEERYVRQEVLVDGTSEALYGTRVVGEAKRGEVRSAMSGKRSW
jgi:hypothetical protein